MLLALLIFCILFSILFIVKSEDGRYLSKISLLVFALSVIINILLINDAVFIGIQNDTMFLYLFEIHLIDVFTYVRVITYISVISFVCYLGFHTANK